MTDQLQEMPAMLIFYELQDEPGTFAIEQPYASTDVGSYIRGVVGVGKPYYAYSNTYDFGFNIWNGYVPNWTGAPLCSNLPETNTTTIMAMLDNPPVGKITAPV